MINYYNGNLLESGCEIICHQVNEFGAMGAGIALQIKKRFPQTYSSYFAHCKRHKTQELFGTVLFTMEANTIIANCFSQQNWQTDYAMVKKIAKQLKEYAIKNGFRAIGIPHCYGCGLAHGDWNIVLGIFKNEFETNENIELQIWRFEN